MLLELDVESLNSTMCTVHTHKVNGKSISWGVGNTFDKKALGSPNIFKYINGYLNHIEGARREKIFATFERIKYTIDSVFQTSSLIKELQPLIKNLYDDIDLNEIAAWLSFHSDIVFPSKLDDIYTESDEKPGSREKTYLKSDYIELVSMTIALRLMVPVWGEFINCTKKDTGTLFKEMYAFQLLAFSNLANCNAMEKLKVYVMENIQQDKPMMASIINGVSSENFPQWLLSKVVLNRLCVGDVSGISANSTLITNIWNFINHKVNNTQATSSFSSMVKEKEFESGDQNNEHNASRLEGYKIKTELPLGDIVILEHFVQDPYKCALRLYPEVNIDLLNGFINSNHQLVNSRLHECQVTLAKYVFKPIFPPRAMVHLNKVDMINCISVAQTVLWQKGHKVLCALMSAIDTDNNERIMMSGMDSRSRIPKEMLEEISQLFPYNKVSQNRKKSKSTSAVIDAIDELSVMFSKRDWILTIDDSLVRQVSFGKKQDTNSEFVNRRYSCPSDIKILLAKLIIDITKGV